MNIDNQRISYSIHYPMHNETWIIEKFNELTQGDQPYVLVSINIKGFKFFNLKYGWQRGNQILYQMYEAMHNVLKEGEYVAHCYSDHFVMLLHANMFTTKDEDAYAFIQGIIAGYVDEIFEIEDEVAHKNIYASFGIYPMHLFPTTYHEAFELAELFRCNDINIKQRTYSINYYKSQVLDSLLYTNDLRISTAFALQKGEYQVYIQPKVSTQTGKIIGGEALLRRFDGNGNPVALDQFLPILNEDGYIRKVDWFVFETACEAMANALSKGHRVVPISFNISKDFFYDVFILDTYISTYKKYSLSQEFIEFELMETISLDDTNRMIEVIKRFKQAGFKCSLDDFGNGYSSFGVLLNAAFDYIKLDRIFFINPLDDANRKILKSVITMLKSLGFKIVAEGVETKEYVDYLTSLGCDMIQGYYFYRPMPIDAFMQLLQKDTFEV